LASTGSTESADDQAAHWAVLAAYEEMTPESHADLKVWLNADSRNQGAYIRASAGLYAMEGAVIKADQARALEIDNGFHPTHVRRGLFRRVLTAATGSAITALVAVLVMVAVSFFTLSKPNEVASAQTLNLRDGSVATLQQGARIEFAFAKGIRKVTLLGGQASFHVAKDKAHPFVVQSGDVYAQATGTVYSVGRLGHRSGTVRVTEGSVLVWARDEREQAILLHAGGAFTLDPGPKRHASQAMTSPHPPPHELAQISFDNVPIQSAVARFNRVNSIKIIIADPAIGATRIVGLFRANDPEPFAQSVAALTDSQSKQSHGNIVIKKK
jgi:transmembrane sensor